MQANERSNLQFRNAPRNCYKRLDLFGPFLCRSDVNKRATKKVWGIVIIDVNANATHCDIVLDYGA